MQSSDQCKAVLPLLQRLKRQLSSASLQWSLPSIYTWKIFQKYLPSNLFNCAIVFCKTDQVYPFVVVLQYRLAQSSPVQSKSTLWQGYI